MAMMLGRVLGSKYDDDGFLCVQIDTFGKDKTVGWFQLSNPHGLQMRPLDPDGLTACQAYYWWEGSQGYAMLANDPRTQGNVSIQLQKGEAILHHPLGVGFVRMHADGGISLFTTDDNTTNGRSVALSVSSTGLTFAFPFGNLRFDNTGFHVLTNAGARLDLGALTAPAPLNIIPNMSIATLSGSIVHVEGSAVHTGTEGGAPLPVALAAPLLALGSAVQAVLAALEVPGNLTCAAPGSPVAIGGPLLSLISAAATALATAIATAPSVTSTATGV